jgi:bifunctional non-homologous end joining protein LigD
MLATPWPDAFDDDDWWFELKWDGYRCLADHRQSELRLRSRRGLDLSTRFPEIADLELPAGWVLDGEVVVFDESGRPDFSLLQAGEPAGYVVFDVLETPAGPLFDRPLEERRSLLAEADLPSQVVTAEPVKGDGVALFDAIVAQGLEGMMAKRSGSLYTPGRRSPDWRKIAYRKRMRAVVGGWLPGQGGRASTFGSLLMGLVAGDDRLRYIGAVGSGFSDSQLGPIANALHTLERPISPFGDPSAVPARAHWTAPALVIAIEYREWTRDRRLRAPVFKGVETEPWTEVTWEAEAPPGLSD